jgi:hypothetical protein
MRFKHEICSQNFGQFQTIRCVWQAFIPSFFHFSHKKSNFFLHINKQLSLLFSHKKFKTHFTFISHQSILITIPGKIKWEKALPNIPLFKICPEKRSQWRPIRTLLYIAVGEDNHALSVFVFVCLCILTFLTFLEQTQLLGQPIESKPPSLAKAETSNSSGWIYILSRVND